MKPLCICATLVTGRLLLASLTEDTASAVTVTDTETEVFSRNRKKPIPRYFLTCVTFFWGEVSLLHVRHTQSWQIDEISAATYTLYCNVTELRLTVCRCRWTFVPMYARSRSTCRPVGLSDYTALDLYNVKFTWRIRPAGGDNKTHVQNAITARRDFNISNTSSLAY